MHALIPLGASPGCTYAAWKKTLEILWSHGFHAIFVIVKPAAPAMNSD